MNTRATYAYCPRQLMRRRLYATHAISVNLVHELHRCSHCESIHCPHGCTRSLFMTVVQRPSETALFYSRHSYYTGCANKKQSFRKNSLSQFIISVNAANFFTKFTAFTEEDSRHIRSKFRHNICYGLKITTN